MGKRLYSVSADIRDRDTIEIGGVDYELLEKEDLGPIEQARLLAHSKKLDRMMEALQREDISEEEIERILENAGESFDVFLLLMLKGFNRDALAQLDGAQKMKIFEVFTQAAREKQEAQKPVSLPAPTGKTRRISK